MYLDKRRLPGHVGKQACLWHSQFLVVEDWLCLASELMKLGILQTQQGLHMVGHQQSDRGVLRIGWLTVWYLFYVLIHWPSN